MWLTDRLVALAARWLVEPDKSVWVHTSVRACTTGAAGRVPSSVSRAGFSLLSHFAVLGVLHPHVGFHVDVGQLLAAAEPGQAPLPSGRGGGDATREKAESISDFFTNHDQTKAVI